MTDHNKVKQGLNDEEVQQRIENGQVNFLSNTITKTYKQIFLDNTITFFNIINVILLGLVILVGSLKNMLFIMIIVINTLVGIIQEIRSKRTLDKLTILTVSQIEVIRNGSKISIPVDQIVLGDILFLKQGLQIPTDAVIIEGRIEVNESLLTGESDPQFKGTGASLFSGSFVTSGQAYCEVMHVGKDNYMEKITAEAKKFKKHRSELNRNLDRILKLISIIIIPIGVGLFVKQYFLTHLTFRSSILQTVAALLGMIPEGLVLLTSVAMTIGVMRLAKKKVLVQELSCMETLARVDVLCLDKTGTITEGRIAVEKVEKLKEVDIDLIMGNLMHAVQDENVTAMALREQFKEADDFELDHLVPFSSDRKYSGAAFKGKGTYLMGANKFLFPHGYEHLQERCHQLAKEGYRLIVVGYSPNINQDTEIPEGLEPIAIVQMSDVIRKEAKETLDYFVKQGVEVKIISGDDPVTVSAIAKRAGLKSAEKYIDAASLQDEEAIEQAVQHYSVFGRVTPKQKKQMIMAIKKQGHTVAMTGDGVNDVLAFKESDVSVAMASGSDAAKHAANLVLMDCNFAVMPNIVNEGRRVINNISYAASMFLIKTVFSVILSLQTILLGQGYPFAPIQLSIISSCAVGIPTFLMTQESNFNRVDGHFFKQVFKNAVPTALTIVICITLITSLGSAMGSSSTMLTTASVLITGWNYMLALERVYSPLSTYRKVVIYAMRLVYLISILIGQGILELVAVDFNVLLLLVSAITFSPLFFEWSTKLLEWIIQLWEKHGLEKWL